MRGLGWRVLPRGRPITFPTLAETALPPLAYLALQIVESNFITPTILGRRLEPAPEARIAGVDVELLTGLGVLEDDRPDVGQGDLALADVVLTLERAGYQGWYVIEQDTAITGDLPGEGEGPVTGVRDSMLYLRDVVAPLVEQDA